MFRRLGRLGALSLLVVSACHEDVVLLDDPHVGGDDASWPACMICAANGDCRPAADGTVCSAGVCQSGACVDTTCPERASWIAVAAGEGHSCAVAWNGELWCWGRNADGQLGVGDSDQRLEPVQVTGDWIAASGGWRFTCAVARDWSAACWGKNSEGQVAAGEVTPSEPAPRPLVDLPPWRTVDAGQDHACAIADDGALYCWGRNADSQLGAAEPARSPTPLLLDDGIPRVWRQSSAGARHTCAVDWDARLWCWGENADGQLGSGDTARRSAPAEVGVGTAWVDVAGGARHTCGIDGAGQLWCWGSNHDGPERCWRRRGGQSDSPARPHPVVRGLEPRGAGRRLHLRRRAR